MRHKQHAFNMPSHGPLLPASALLITEQALWKSHNNPTFHSQTTLSLHWITLLLTESNLPLLDAAEERRPLHVHRRGNALLPMRHNDHHSRNRTIGLTKAALVLHNSRVQSFRPLTLRWPVHIRARNRRSCRAL